MVDKATLLADLTPEETAWYNTIAPLQRRKLLRVFELRRDPLNAEVDPADACIECKAYKYPCFKRIQPTSRRKRNCLTCGNKACSFSNGPSERAPGGHTGAVGHGEHNHESDELVDELDEVDELDDDIESEDDGGEYKPAISQPRARKPTTPVPAPVPMTHAAPGPMPVPVPVPVPATAPVPIPATAPVPIPAPVPKPTPRAKTPPPRREPAEIDPDPEETLRLLESAGRGGFSKTGMASTAANIRWEKHRREKAERAEKMAKGAGTTKGVNKAKAAKAQQQQLQHLAAAAVQSAAAAGPSYSAAASRLDLATASRPIPQAPAHPPRTTAPTPLQQTLPFRPLPQDPAPIPNQHTSAPRPIPHTPAPPPPQATATPSGSTSPIHAGAPQYEPYSFATDGHALPNGNGEPSRKRKANEVERSPSEPEARHSLPTPDSQRIALAGDSSVDENNTTGDLSADRQALFANESLITKRRKRERQSCAYHLLGVRDPDARSWPAPNDAYYNIHRSLFESEPISKWQVSSPFDPPASFDAASDAGYDDESDASSVASGSSVIVDILRPSELDRVPFLSRLVTLEHDVTTIVSKVAKLRPELFAGASEDEKYLPSYMYKPGHECTGCIRDGIPCVVFNVPAPPIQQRKRPPPLTTMLPLPPCLGCLMSNDPCEACVYRLQFPGQTILTKLHAIAWPARVERNEDVDDTQIWYNPADAMPDDEDDVGDGDDA